ncbi:uncharacterized protein LOC119348783 [Triticum dicoccoides]|uniref:uncharacterized protein LOC119348783 n=1 Tax=Triticum dicoccoides TaxID=85692 RepID=UPI00188F75F4|nr:uncharacterized protein LOC119348783 [Triticum dicoccoides]XP_044413554.1 uncharacterized protein LOC123137772 [Triticum aestivum]
MLLQSSPSFSLPRPHPIAGKQDSAHPPAEWPPCAWKLPTSPTVESLLHDEGLDGGVVPIPSSKGERASPCLRTATNHRVHNLPEQPHMCLLAAQSLATHALAAASRPFTVATLVRSPPPTEADRQCSDEVVQRHNGSSVPYRAFSIERSDFLSSGPPSPPL